MNDGQLLTVDMLRLVSSTNPDVLNDIIESNIYVQHQMRSSVGAKR